MKSDNVTMVRIYLTEEKAHLGKLMQHLHDEEKVQGVTVFRAISGFGKSGVVHSSSLLDMSLNLPIVVEFFDDSEKVMKILDHLDTFIEPGHIVSWPAQVNAK
jgi:PII-like signaling protein